MRYQVTQNDSGTWKVTHTPSGYAVVGEYTELARPIRKRHAEHIAKYCERKAPSDDPREVARMLGREFVQSCHNWVNPRFAEQRIEDAFPL